MRTNIMYYGSRIKCPDWDEKYKHSRGVHSSQFTRPEHRYELIPCSGVSQ
jgi:hypothetical protein